MIEVAIPRQRWEIEFMDDGTIVVEKFKIDGEIYNDEELEVLIREFSD